MLTFWASLLGGVLFCWGFSEVQWQKSGGGVVCCCSWAASERASKIEMLCVNMRSKNANRARSVLRPRGMLSIRRRLKLNSELARAVRTAKKNNVSKGTNDTL